MKKKQGTKVYIKYALKYAKKKTKIIRELCEKIKNHLVKELLVISFSPLCLSELSFFLKQALKKYSCLKNQKYCYPELQRMKKYGFKGMVRKNHTTI